MMMNNTRSDNPKLQDNSSTCTITKRFPIRLHEMLCDVEAKGYSDIVSWLPCGTMFKVIKHKDFAERIMPLYYRHSRYKSFLRQLSMYKFVRIKDGDLRGTYHHPLFLRGRLDLVQLVRRNDKKEDHIHGKVTTPDDTDMIGIKRTLPRRNAGAAVHKRRMTDAFVKGEVATEDSEQEFELFDFSGDEAVADQSDEEQHDSEIMLGNAHRIEFLDEGVDCVRSLAVPALSFAPSSMLHSDGSKGDPSSADASSVERCHFKCSFDYRQGGLTGGSPMALSTFGSTASIPDDILEEIIKTFHVSSSSATDQARHSTNTTRMYW